MEGAPSNPSSGILIQDNHIGYGSLYSGFIPNEGPGVSITEYVTTAIVDTNSIGGNNGPGVLVQGGTDPNRALIQWNSIGHNDDGGVVVDGAVNPKLYHNSFSGDDVEIGVINGGYAEFNGSNRFYQCGTQCIDLGMDGVTANDFGDGDTGPNDLLNYPELGTVRACGGKTYLQMGWLDIPADMGTATVYFWSSQACDASGHGPAEQMVDLLSVPAPGGMLTATFDGELTGKVLTAATVAGRDTGVGFTVWMTSELSACATVLPTYGGDADDDCSWDARDLALIIGALNGEALPPGGNADCTEANGTDRADLPCTVGEIFTPHIL